MADFIDFYNYRRLTSNGIQDTLGRVQWFDSAVQTLL